MVRAKKGSEPKEARSGYPAGTRRLSVNLDEKLIKAVKRRALDQDVSLTDLVTNS